MASYPQHDRSITAVSLFSGAGMLDIGVGLAFGDIFDTIAYVEREAHAAAVLATAMESGRIHPATIWSDVRTVCGPLFGHYVREALGGEPLGAVIAGYPCPDFSCAGKRAGVRGVKGSLWWNLAEAIAEYEPELLFLENVGGHTSKGFDTVCSALRSMDYRIAAGLFTASEVGASHKRERLFILAHRVRPVGQSGTGRRGVREGDPGLADSQGGGCGILREPSRGDRFIDGGDGLVANTESRRPRELRYCRGPKRDRGRGDAQSDGGGSELANASGGECRPGGQTAGGDRGPGQSDRHTDRPSRQLADAQGGGERERFGQFAADGSGTESGVERHGENVADADGPGLPSGRIEGQGRLLDERRGDVPDPDGQGLPNAEHGGVPQTQERRFQEGAATTQLHRARFPDFAPGPGALDAWSQIVSIAPDFNPALSRAQSFAIRAVHAGYLDVSMVVRSIANGKDAKWLGHQIAEGVAKAGGSKAFERAIRAVPDVLADRPQQLRLLGNGVVSLEAAYGFATLGACLLQGDG